MSPHVGSLAMRLLQLPAVSTKAMTITNLRRGWEKGNQGNTQQQHTCDIVCEMLHFEHQAAKAGIEHQIVVEMAI